MKPSLESLLSESLNVLKDLNAPPQSSAPGPTESLDLITHEQVRNEVLEHINDDRDAIANGTYQVDVEEIVQQNEIDHAVMRSEISEMRNMVGAVVTAMEMLTCVSSMESIEPDAVSMANTAIGNISVLAGEPNVPAFVVEDGKMTTASMESIVDFIVGTLKKMKAWIKEKWENIVMGMRRGIRTDQTTRLRIEAIQKRISSLGDDHGIPAKQMRYQADLIGYLYRDGSPIQFDKSSLATAMKEALDITAFANKSISGDAAGRSMAISENIGKVLMTRDSIDAEKMLRDMFGKSVGKNPSEGYLTYGKELTGGITFLDPYLAAGRPSRDTEWIAALADYISIPFGHHRLRKSGMISTKANTLEEISVMLDTAIEILESDAYTDEEWYTDINEAWREAHGMYDRMIGMVTNNHLPQLNNELWRALDVACSAMFVIVERAYYQTLYMRAPSFRLIQGLVYVCEEQVKAYVAVNR